MSKGALQVIASVLTFCTLAFGFARVVAANNWGSEDLGGILVGFGFGFGLLVPTGSGALHRFSGWLLTGVI